MNGVQTRFKCKLDVKRCKRFVFPPSSLLPRSNALKTKAIRYFQTDRTLTRIVSPPLHLWLQSFKRPELSVRGLVFAYRTEYARKTGIRTDIIRGEDGYLALQLKQFGKIAFVRKRRARAVTGYGTVGADGTLFNSFKVRVVSRLKGIGGLFTKKKEYKDEESNLVKKK